MNLQTIVIILASIYGLVLLAGFLFVVFLFGRLSVKNDPRKALVYIISGSQMSRPKAGKMAGNPTKLGCKYIYGNNTVFVPASYREYYYQGKRIIYLTRLGQLIATPFSAKETLSDDEKNELIYELVSSHIGADSMRALQGKFNLNIVMIIVIVIIVSLLAAFGYNYMKGTMVANQVSTQEQKQEIKVVPIERGTP